MKIIETAWIWSGGLSVRPKTTHIVLHHAAATQCTAQDIDRWHKGNGWSGIGYHYFVKKDGYIYRGRPEWAVGAHVSGHNSYTIGICAEGDYSTETAMPQAQREAIEELITDIIKRYGKLTIVGHRDLGGSQCPGKYYPLEHFKDYPYRQESEGLTVTQYEELKAIINKQNTEISELKAKLAERTGYYNYIDSNMPSWARPTIQRLVSNGMLQGNEKKELQLTMPMMRLLVILDRIGILG